MDSIHTNTTVKIYNNMKPSDGFTVHFRKTSSKFSNFLEVCSDVLKINAQKVYDTIGDEILSL